MSSSETPPVSASTEELAADLSTAAISKKQLKKEARKAETAGKAASTQRQQTQAEEDDPFASSYGDVPIEDIESKVISGRSWTDIGNLSEASAGSSVLIHGALQAIHPVSKKMAFVVLHRSMSSVQCMLIASATD